MLKKHKHIKTWIRTVSAIGHLPRVISRCWKLKQQPEAAGNKYRVCGVYSREPRDEVYCVRLSFSGSKLCYFFQASTMPTHHCLTKLDDIYHN